MIARISLLAAVLAVAGAARADTLNRWVQFGPDNAVFVRSISSAGTASCPMLAIDGATTAMAPRFAPTAAYPILMCEAQIPLGGYTAKQAMLDGVALKLPVANPKRILVIGDTGCRVNGGTTAQDCNNANGPLDFPTAALGAYASTFDPDLIVHTGDFYYREADALCTGANKATCGLTRPDGTTAPPVGQTWDSWNADWFIPGRALMAAAPMAITRGNHESCDRGAVGWFHLLAVQTYPDAAALETAANCGPKDGFTSYRAVSAANPDPMPRDPNDTTDPYVVQAGPIALIMFDISYASDTVYQPALVKTYAAQLAKAMSQTGGKPVFFVAHKPVYGINGSVATLTGAKPYAAGGDINGQQLFAQAGGSGISLFISGHTHNFQVVDVNGLVPQLVIGNSGTLLDGQQVPLGYDLTNATYQVADGSPVAGSTTDAVATNDYTATYLTAINDFGFAVLDQVTDGAGATTGYVANIYNLHANRSGRCTIVLSPRSMTCER